MTTIHTDSDSPSLTIGKNADNVIQNFQLDNTNLRGRMVRLGTCLDDIVNAHEYPDAVNQLLAETLVTAATLASMLKYDGIFTLQMQSNGPITMLVADVTSDGGIRACAGFDEDKVKEALSQDDEPNLTDLLGTGHMAFTVDQGPDTERYQGIVELKGPTLLDSVQHYFTQSEQIGTGMKLHAEKVEGQWRASAIMLQHMPEDEINPESGSGNVVEDDWRRTMILLGSCTEEELVSPDLDSQALLYRLFHEEDLRVFEPKYVHKDCRCSRDKLINAVRMMPKDDIDHIFENDEAILKCEFCSKGYKITREDLLN